VKKLLGIIAKALFDIWGLIRCSLWKNTKPPSGSTSILVYGKHRFRFANYGDIAEMLYSRQHLVRYGKGFEAASLGTFLKCLKEGDVVLDVGANVGIYSLLASEVIGPKGKVYAFEPTPSTYDALQRNFHYNHVESQCICIRKGLSDKNSVGRVASPELAKRYQSGDAFNYIETVDISPTDAGAIELTTIDEFARANEITRIDVIKIDIEGAELLCLKGAEAFLRSKDRPIILFEAIDDNSKRFGYSAMDVILYLSQYGYRFEVVELNQYLAIPVANAECSQPDA
jgi:FkbM family methyltransferase